MRVILKKEVANLGDAGEIIQVAPGYGRNYLIPRGLAILANESSMAKLEHNQRVADAIRRKDLSAAQAMADQLSKTAVSIKREAGDDDRLFGSVTNRDIAEALAAEGVEVDRKLIKLDEPIKGIGLYTVSVRLHREATAQVRVYVIRA